MAMAMSLRDADHCTLAIGRPSITPTAQPRSIGGEGDCPAECSVRANVQEIRECVRHAIAQLEGAGPGPVPRSVWEGSEVSLRRGRGLVMQTEQLFREWGAHKACVPVEQYRRRLAHDKLRRALGEEVAGLGEAARRVAVARIEADDDGEDSGPEIELLEASGSDLSKAGGKSASAKGFPAGALFRRPAFTRSLMVQVLVAAVLLFCVAPYLFHHAPATTDGPWGMSSSTVSRGPLARRMPMDAAEKMKEAVPLTQTLIFGSTSELVV